MTKEAKLLGLTLNNSQAQSVDDMRDAFERANLAVSGVVRQVVAYLSPAIKGIVDTFTQFIMNAEGAKIGAQIGEGILNGARVLADYADQFVNYVGGVWEHASQVSAQWADAWDMASRVGGIFEMAAAAMKAVVASLLHAAGELYIRFGMIVEAVKMGAAILSGTSVSAAYDQMQQNLAPMKAFNASLKQSADDAVAAFQAGFSKTFADKTAVSQVAGPFRQALEAGIVQAAKNAKQADAATKEQPREWEAAAKSAAQVLADNLEARLKQVKGLDSRSQEGIDAFFRWQRGDTGNNDIQKEQLTVLQDIRNELAAPDDAVMVDMGGA
jgi:Ni/Co efflux regulator RcnB